MPLSSFLNNLEDISPMETEHYSSRPWTFLSRRRMERVTDLKMSALPPRILSAEKVLTGRKGSSEGWEEKKLWAGLRIGNVWILNSSDSASIIGWQKDNRTTHYFFKVRTLTCMLCGWWRQEGHGQCGGYWWWWPCWCKCWCWGLTACKGDFS